jgi:cysteine desulfurase
MKRIYLDNAAATPVDAGILKVVTETARKFPANPSALHKEGVVARKVLEVARAEIFRGRAHTALLLSPRDPMK